MSDGGAAVAARRRAYLAMGIAIAIGSVSFTLIEITLRELSAMSLAAGRVVFSALALVVVVTLQPRRRTPIDPEHRWRVFWCGLSGSALFHVLFSWGQTRTSPAVAAITLATMPALVAWLERWFLRHALTAAQVVGLVLSLAGVTVIGLQAAGADGANADAASVTTLAGVVTVGAATLVWSAQTVAIRSIADRYDPFWLNTPGTIAGVVVCLAIAAPDLGEFGSLSPTGWLLVIWLGSVSSALIYAILAFTMRSLPATTTASLGTLVTPLSILVGWAVLDDRPSAVTLLGGLVVIGGVALVTLRPASRSVGVLTTG
jgi:drug/metabolite transporter (DMT)-like permease